MTAIRIIKCVVPFFLNWIPRQPAASGRVVERLRLTRQRDAEQQQRQHQYLFCLHNFAPFYLRRVIRHLSFPKYVKRIWACSNLPGIAKSSRLNSA